MIYDLVRQLARHATGAYVEYRHHLPHGSMWKHIELELGNVQGVVSHNNRTNTTIIAISGSDEMLDWLDNTNLDSTEIAPGVHGHEGFVKHARIFDGLLRDNRDAMDTIQQSEFVYLTGHSLGGATATLLLCLGWSDIVTLTATYASPRALRSGSDTRHPCPEKLIRVYRPADFVPDVPLNLRGWFFGDVSGWEHVGAPWILQNDGSFDFETTLTREIYRRIKRVLTLWNPPTTWFDLLKSPHSPLDHLRLLSPPE